MVSIMRWALQCKKNVAISYLPGIGLYRGVFAIELVNFGDGHIAKIGSGRLLSIKKASIAEALSLSVV
jgi:hypothetical protein